MALQGSMGLPVGFTGFKQSVSLKAHLMIADGKWDASL